MIDNYRSQIVPVIYHQERTPGVRLRNWLLVMIVFLLGQFGSLNAQNIANYSFSATSGTFIPITGGTNVSGIYGDDLTSGLIPLGFTFYYMGNPYTQVYANSNGYITFASSPTTSTSTMRTNGFSIAGADHPIIAPFWDDLMGFRSSGAAPVASYVTTGTPGSQVFTMEFLNWLPFSGSNVLPNMSFQINLEEATGTISFVYRQETGNNPVSGSIGISYSSSAFASLNNASASPVVSYVTSSNSINAKPATGQVYRFSPPSGVPANVNTPLTFPSIGVASLTVEWTDNSTNESFFKVYYSTDNVTYLPLATVNSTTSGTTGGSYSYVHTGLSPSTLYYYKVVSCNESSVPGSGVIGSESTLAASFCGTKIVGPSGTADYPTIAAALNAAAISGLACSSVIELEPAYVSSVESFPLVIPVIPGTSSTKMLTIRPQSGATNLSITTTAAQTINFASSSYVIFDGRPGGIGGSRELTIDNTSTTGCAIQFVNGASNNTIKYCNITGVNTSTTSGVVVFGITTAALGNNNNTITNNNIHDGLTLPTMLVYSAGTASKMNTGNVISNNELSNYFNPATSSAAVSCQANNSDWIISDNVIYQSASRTVTTAAAHFGIWINSSAGNGFIISNNTIGGSAPGMGGSPWTYLGTVGTRFIAYNISTVGTLVPTSINGNRFGNFAMYTNNTNATIPGVFSGIAVNGGSVDIGTVSPNLIGSLSTNGNITINYSGASSTSYGIASASSGVVNIQNNIVAGITLTTAVPDGNKASFNGICISAGNGTIKNNIIGGSLPNSITNNTGATSTTGMITTGITFLGASVNVSNNTISNISYTGGGTLSNVVGMNLTNGAITADNNIISKLTNISVSAGVGASASISGIVITSTIAGSTISRNQISELENTATTGDVSINGIHYSGATTGTNLITANQVSAFKISSSGALATMNGIYIGGGVSTYSNNVINLGLDVTGASVTRPYVVNGMIKASATNNNFYYNTIRIQGTGVDNGTAFTSGFKRTSTGTDEFKNNIVSNTRTNLTTGGNHYAIMLNAATSFTTGRNDYWVTGAVFGNLSTDYATFNDWKTGTSLDATSLNIDPLFISSLNSHISTSSSTPLESGAITLAGITTDFEGDQRPGPVGSVNGGGLATDIGADEFDGMPVSMDLAATALVSPTNPACFTSAETVILTIKNMSSAPVDFSLTPATVSVAATGVNPLTFTPVVMNSGILAGGATQNVTISTTYDMSFVGSYTFNGSVAITGDGNPANDAITPVTINITAGTASSNVTSTCGGQSVNLSHTGVSTGIQWQSSIDGITWVNETGTGSTTSAYTVTPMDTTQYRVLVCGLHTSNVITIDVTVLSAPVSSSVTRCGAGPVTLSASGVGTLKWFSTPTSPSPIGIGTDLFPVVTDDSTFYVSSFGGGQLVTVGKPNNSGTGAQQTSTAYNIFSVFTPVILQGVYIYPGAAGNAVLELRNSSGVLLRTATLPVTAANVNQRTWFPLSWNLSVGNDFRLAQGAGSVSMFRNDAGVTFPYTIPGVLSITNTSAGLTYFYFAYDWNVVIPCESPRTAVNVTVTPAPAINASTLSGTICTGSSTTLSVSSANTGYNYSWSPATGLSATTGTSITASPSASVTYTVSASDASGCLISDTMRVNVLQSPVINAVSTPATICPGASSQLTAVDNTPAVFTVGSGTITNSNISYPAPYGTRYWGARHQFLITAAELTAAGLTPGDISSLAFDVTALNTAIAHTGFEIKMGLTTVSSLSAFATGLTTVHTSPSYTAVVGWNTHAFSTPFNWDGTSNIIIETCFNNNAYTYNASVKQTATTYASSIYYRADAAGVCSNTGVTTANQHPNMRFTRVFNHSYAWTPSATLTSGSISNPVATPASTTTYTVSVTAANGCATSSTAEVVIAPSNTVNAVIGNNVSCYGSSNGMASASSVGGSAWTYTWNSVPVQSNPMAMNLAAGTFSVISQNEFGCADTAAVIITQPAAVNATVVTTSVSCFGGTNGTASASVSGGVTPYTYLWNPVSQTTSSVNGLLAGSYALDVIDANGCQVSVPVTITEPLALTANVNAQNVTCLGGSDGSVSVVVAGGTTPYTYEWNTSPVSATPVVSGLPMGTYTITTTDANGCSQTEVAIVNDGVLVTVAITGNDTICHGSSSTLTASGATTYSWNTGGNTAAINVSPTATTTYTVTGTNANGCISSAVSYEVTVGSAVIVTITGNDTVCAGLSSTLAATGATSYSWSTGDNTASVNVTPTATSTYTVTGTNANGCTSAPVTYEVAVETLPSASLTYTTLNGMDFDFTASGNGTYSWDFGDVTTGLGPVVSHSYTASGSYNVILTATNSCGSDTAMQTIIVSGISSRNQSGLMVYPNPSKGLFNIEVSGNEINRLIVLDVDGRIVIDKSINDSSLLTTTIDLSGFAKGVYTLRLIGEKNDSFRLILN